MSTFVTILIICFVIGFVITIVGGPVKKEEPKKKELTVYRLISNVRTYKDYKYFSKRFESIENKYRYAEDDRYDNTYKKYQDALGILFDKIFFYQYYPEPLYVDKMNNIQYENLFKIFPIDKYKELLESVDPDEKNWIEITADDYENEQYEIKEGNEDFKFFKYSWKIHHEDITREQKISRFKSYQKRNPNFDYYDYFYNTEILEN